MAVKARVSGRRLNAVVVALAILTAGNALAIPGAGERQAPGSGLAPDATLRLQEGRLSSTVDYMWGRGRLSFRAGRYNFSVSGAPMVAASVLSVTATGKVFNLSRLADFAGRYQRVEGAVAPGAGPLDVVMRNEHGVVLQLQLHTSGVPGSAGTGGVTIRLND